MVKIKLELGVLNVFYRKLIWGRKKGIFCFIYLEKIFFVIFYYI